MARTATMRLLELMVLKEDIAKVIEYIGKAKCFQFDTDLDEIKSSISNSFKDILFLKIIFPLTTPISSCVLNHSKFDKYISFISSFKLITYFIFHTFKLFFCYY